MATDDISDGTWTFYDSFAAFPLNRLHESRDRTNVVGEFMVKGVLDDVAPSALVPTP